MFAAVLFVGCLPAGGTGSLPCSPVTCSALGAECGQAPDGCGGTLECGGCSGVQLCGGGGPNRCGTGTCTPRTCAEAAKNCGMVSDGCAGQLQCGTCTGGNTCGGGGIANVCGGVCPASCPTGSACDALGRCVVSSAMALSVAPSTSRLHGRVTINGASPLLAGCPGRVGALRLSEAGSGDVFEVQVRCPTASGPFVYEANLPDGTWEARFRFYGLSSPLTTHGFEKPDFVVGRGIVMPAAAPVDFDFKPIAVSGELRMQGTTGCGTRELVFRHQTDGTTNVAVVGCTPPSYSTTLTAGRWDVLLRTPNWIWNENVRRLATIDVSAAATHHDFDLAYRRVSGAISQQGSSLGYCPSGSPTEGVGRVHFTNALGERHVGFLKCSSSANNYGVLVPDDTWRVTVTGEDFAISKLHGIWARVADLTVAGGDLARNYDVTTVPVAGTLTMNGQTPVLPCHGSEPSYGLRLVDPAGNELKYAVPCTSTPAAFSARAPPGAYVATVGPNSEHGSLPWGGLPAGNVTVPSGQPVALDVKTVRVRALVKVDGQVPRCAEVDEVVFAMESADPLRNSRFRGKVACDMTGEMWLEVPHGTYRVTTDFDWDQGPTVLEPALTLTGDRLDLEWNIRRRYVTVTLEAPQPVTCGAGESFIEVRNLDTGERRAEKIACGSMPSTLLRFSAGTYDVSLVAPDREPVEWMSGALRYRLARALVVP